MSHLVLVCGQLEGIDLRARQFSLRQGVQDSHEICFLRVPLKVKSIHMFKAALVLFRFFCTFLASLFAMTFPRVVQADDFYPLDDEIPIVKPWAPKAKASKSGVFSPVPVNQAVETDGSIAGSTAGGSSVEQSTDVFYEDLSGTSVSGVPRLIRANPETEVFLRNVNGGFVLPPGARHNLMFDEFQKAMKTDKSVTFKYDAISRRVLHMDGLEGVKQRPKPSNPSGPSERSKGSK